MKIIIKVPSMGESISEATISSFIKTNGSSVKVDDELLELETDKVNQVLYAQQAGTISWDIKEGDIVKIGQTLGTIDDSKEASLTNVEKIDKKIEVPVDKQITKSSQGDEDLSMPISTKDSSTSSLASKSQSIPSSRVRVTKDSFLSELAQTQEQQAIPSQPASSGVQVQPTRSITPSSSSTPEKNSRETRKKISKLRKVIASRLVDVLQQTAMLTTFNEVDMTKIISMRETYKETFLKQYQVRLGFMPFFVKVVISALKNFPEVNAYIDGEDLVYRNYFDIGIAVGTDKGLFVPVVQNCDSLSFAEIERSIEVFANKARDGKLLPGDLQGGGFTITNGGTYGSLLSTPILNPPQSAILGMHKIMKRPVVVGDQIVIRQMMYLALSYDHRVIDGREAVSFLVNIKNVLEDPSRLLIGL